MHGQWPTDELQGKGQASSHSCHMARCWKAAGQSSMPQARSAWARMWLLDVPFTAKQVPLTTTPGSCSAVHRPVAHWQW